MDRVAEAIKAAEVLFSSERSHANYHAGCINLVASQNLMSPLVGRLLGSSFSDHFMSGAIGHRPHGGARWIDVMEEAVDDLATKVFAPFAPEWRPTSGSQANEIVLSLAIRPGDAIISPSPVYGSHPSMRPEGLAGSLGAHVYDLPFLNGTGDIDLDALEQLVRRVRPRLISIGTAKVLFADDVERIAWIASHCDAYIHYDGAHVLGLIAGQAFDNPLDHGAHFVTGSTQKTLPGPIGGMIISASRELGAEIARVVDTRIDNYQNNRIAALGYVLAESLAYGREFGTQIIANAQLMGKALADEGIAVEGGDRGFTRTHMLLIHLSGLPQGAQRRLERLGIFATETKIWPRMAGDEVRPALRIGTATVTRQGYSAEEIREVAGILAAILKSADPAAEVAVRIGEISRSAHKRPISFHLPSIT